ncbi:MAG TPA: hypothetical protein V6C81_28660 [Planktothrix sp.]|jgi:hypothetical protein
MTEQVNSELQKKVASGITSETLYAVSLPDAQIAETIRFRPVSELASAAQAADEMRQTSGDTLLLSDEYMRISIEYARQGRAHYSDSFDYLKKSLNIRANLLEPHDPLLGITYRYVYNKTAGLVPPEESIDLLSRSLKVWELLAEQNNIPAYITQYYINNGYQRLSILYRSIHQTELAKETANKIKDLV